MMNWDMVRCSSCNGHGVTMRGDGGPVECNECGGGGVLYRHRGSGTLAEYPGGPFRGHDRGFTMSTI